MKYDIVWDDSFNTGVEIIDTAHQGLMNCIRRMVNITNDKDADEEKKRWVCEEGIKYFKNYAIKHFAEEEAYMRSIDYADYARHKFLHTEMREITIPELERQLNSANYSEQTVENFLGACMGWLTGHIMIEDRKITHGDLEAIEPQQDREELQQLIHAISQTIQDIFALEVQVDDENYEGENFGKALYYKLTYKNDQGEMLHAIFAVEKPLVSNTVGKMLFITFPIINKTVISAMQQISQQIMRSLRTYFAQADSSFSLCEDEMLSAKEFRREFETGTSQYSLLFQADLGYFAFCIRRP